MDGGAEATTCNAAGSYASQVGVAAEEGAEQGRKQGIDGGVEAAVARQRRRCCQPGCAAARTLPFHLLQAAAHNNLLIEC